MSISLISVPLRKLKGYRLFWISYMLIILVELSVMTVLTNVGDLSVGKSNLDMMHFSFPDIWLNVSWIGKLGNYFMGFLLIYLVAGDEENLTLRQNIINGWSREDAVLSYHFICLFFALASLATVLVLGSIYGYQKDARPIIGVSQIRLLLCYLLQSFLIFQFSLTIALWVKRAVPAAFFFLSWLVIIEPLLGVLVDSKLRRGYSELLPFHGIGKLLPEINPLAPMSGSGIPISANYIWLGFGYLTLFLMLCWVRVRFRDL